MAVQSSQLEDLPSHTQALMVPLEVVLAYLDR